MPRVNPRVNSAVPLPLHEALLQSPRGRRMGLFTPDDLSMRSDQPPPVSDIVIVGGGIIGAGLGAHFAHEPSLRNRFVILDPAPRLVQQMVSAMAHVDQRVMRSPYEHHLAPDGDMQLLDFARLHARALTPLEREQVELALTGQRTTPPVDLFVAHTAHVVMSHRLPQRAYRTAVEGLRRAPDGRWEVRTSRGDSIVARAVVVATGSRPRRIPAPLAEFTTSSGRVVVATEHAIDVAAGERVVVLGAGLTAGHWLYAAWRAGARATWIVRDDEQYRCTDVDTAYFRTEGLASFLRDDLPTRARRLHEDWRGSLMLELREPMEQFAAAGGLSIERGATIDGVRDDGRSLHLELSTGAAVTADRVVVAVGHEPNSGLLAEHAVLVDGFPRLDEATLEIEQAPGLHAAGPMAGLALGPGARLVDGVRLAAECLVPALRARFSAHDERGDRPRSRILGTRAIGAPGEHVA